MTALSSRRVRAIFAKDLREFRRNRSLTLGMGILSPTFADWASVAQDQLSAIDRRMADLNQLKSIIEQCLNCGCQHAQRCKLLTMTSPTLRAP